MDGRSKDAVSQPAKLSTLATKNSANGMPTSACLAEMAKFERALGANRMHVRRNRPFGSSEKMLQIDISQ